MPKGKKAQKGKNQKKKPSRNSPQKKQHKNKKASQLTPENKPNNQSTPKNASTASSINQSPLNVDKEDKILLFKNLGNEEYSNNNFEKAIEYYSKAVELDNELLLNKEELKDPEESDNQTLPNETPENNENNPESKTNGTINNHDKLKEIDDNKIITQKHHDSIHTVYSNRCAAYTHLKRYSKALFDADQCIKLQPTWFKGYIRKANVFIEQKKYQEAEKVYDLATHSCDINDEKGKDVLRKSKMELDTLKINQLDPSEKIVGGHHEQANKFKKLINWLLQGGAKFPKLYLKFYSPEYRAIHAMERIQKDEDICFIPHDFIMTSDIAKDSPIGQKIISSGIELRSKHSYLAAYLLIEREKGEASRWFIYITILPRKFETIPLFFNEEQRKELKGSIALRKIDDRLESLRLEYDALCEAIPEFSRFSLDDFIWARLVVITRIFGLVIDDNKTDGLVPMADMLNHRRPRETKWTYAQKKRGFLITSLQTIKKEAEIFDSYGRKCNSRFFVNYGFSLETNLDNEARLVFELPKTDPQFAIKARHLGFNLNNNNNSYKRDFQIPRQYKEKKVKECFSFLRVLHAQGNEFLIISSHDGLRLDDIPPLSIRNETNVLTSLAVSATKSLKLFDHSLEHDNELLKDEVKYPRFTNARNAILMRRGEKEILTFYVDLMKMCIPLFKTKDAKECMNKIKNEKRLRDSDSMFAQYVTHVVIPLIQRQMN